MATGRLFTAITAAQARRAAQAHTTVVTAQTALLVRITQTGSRIAKAHTS